MADEDFILWCPSARPDRPGAVVLGIHEKSGGLSYLDEPIPAAQVADLVPADVVLTRVVRFAGPCSSQCVQRVGESCGLVNKAVTHAPAVEESSLPQCHLEARCKWLAQIGPEACKRCPLVVTDVSVDDELSKLIADPTVPSYAVAV